MKTLTTIFLFILSCSLYSQEFYSINDGLNPGMDWTTNSAWSNTSGGAPCTCSPPFQTGNADDVHIETNVTLTGNIRLKANSSLLITNTDTLWVTGDADFDNGSILRIDEGGALIISGNLNNSNNSDSVTINGLLSVGGDFTNGVGAELTGNGEVEVSGTVDNSGTIGGSTTDDLTEGSLGDGSYNPPLPIKLTDFYGLKDGEYVNLFWETATEINNDHFYIERSKNGKSFEEIGRVDGGGNSSTSISYSMNDDSPHKGINYYRLTQVDFDGSSETFKIISVRNNDMDSEELELYPNPTNSVFNVKGKSNSNSNNEVLVIVVDMTGLEMYSKVVITESDGKFFTAIDTDKRIPPGMYVVTGSSINARDIVIGTGKSGKYKILIVTE